MTTWYLVEDQVGEVCRVIRAQNKPFVEDLVADDSQRQNYSVMSHEDFVDGFRSFMHNASSYIREVMAKHLNAAKDEIYNYACQSDSEAVFHAKANDAAALDEVIKSLSV